jgi:hypothetical protein
MNAQPTPASLTDDQLIEKMAEMMDWPVRDFVEYSPEDRPDPCYLQEDGPYSPAKLWRDQAFCEWNPLTKWADTMELFFAVQSRLHCAARLDNTGSPWAAYFFDPFLGSPAHHARMLDAQASDKSLQRAICLAALQAVKATPPTP